MKKLIQGIVDFRKKVQKDYRDSFGKLALGQSPDTLFIACSDSRVVPNTFASTNPGDLFVLRNVGNIVPPCGEHGISVSDESEAAAIELAVTQLKISDIIICGHSECAAMKALHDGRHYVDLRHFKSWLRHGEEARIRFEHGLAPDRILSAHNQISQLNVLLQMENIASYPEVKAALNAKKLSIHGWWFDLAQADVYAYDSAAKRFKLIDEDEANRIMNR